MKPTKYTLLMLALLLPAVGAQETLVGRWQSKDRKERMEFTATGRVASFSGAVVVSGQYECHGADQVRLKFEGDAVPQPMKLTYAVDGENLKLKDASGKVVMEFLRWKRESLTKCSGRYREWGQVVGHREEPRFDARTSVP